MYEVMCCDFRFAIAKVLILPKAKKLLCLNFTNAAKGFFNRKFTLFTLLLFTLLLLKALFTFLLFYFYKVNAFSCYAVSLKTIFLALYYKHSRYLPKKP